MLPRWQLYRINNHWGNCIIKTLTEMDKMITEMTNNEIISITVQSKKALFLWMGRYHPLTQIVRVTSYHWYWKNRIIASTSIIAKSHFNSILPNECTTRFAIGAKSRSRMLGEFCAHRQPSVAFIGHNVTHVVLLLSSTLFVKMFALLEGP